MAHPITHQSENGFTGSSWPNIAAAKESITTWNRDPATGWVTSKVIADKATTFTYNPNAFLITNTYDHQHRRIRKEAITGTGSAARHTVTTFLYNGPLLVEEVINETGESPITRRYIWGPDLSGSIGGAYGVGGVQTIVESQNGISTTAHVLSDANGNITALVDDSGNILGTYEYDIFGNPIATPGSMPAGIAQRTQRNPFRFSTKYLDHETELYDYGLRFYDPETGRWLNRDPLAESGGVNLYGFAHNNPAMRVDVNGEFAPLVAFAIYWAVNTAIGLTIDAAIEGEDFNWKNSLGRNGALSLIPWGGSSRTAAKTGKFGLQGAKAFGATVAAETAIGTAYDVGVQGHSFGKALAVNGIGSVLGNGVGSLIGQRTVSNILQNKQ